MAPSGLANFIDGLPPQLRNAVYVHIYQSTFDTHPFFQIGNERMLAFFAQNLKPRFYVAGQYLYREGDAIANFDVVTKGAGAFVAPRYHNQMFAIIHPHILHNRLDVVNAQGAVHVLDKCGFEDTVVNHLALHKTIRTGRFDTSETEKALRYRRFAVRSIQHMESCSLGFAAFAVLKRDYRTQMRQFIRQNITQTWTVVSQQMYMMQNFDTPLNAVDDWHTRQTRGDDDTRESLKQRSAALVQQFLRNFRFEDDAVAWPEWSDSDAEDKPETAELPYEAVLKRMPAYAKIQPPRMEQGLHGHKLLAAYIKYFTEAKIFD